MNEKPGETPNPLNSNPVGGSENENSINQNGGILDANPSEPTQMVEETFASETVANPTEVVTTSVDMVAPVETVNTTNPVEIADQTEPTSAPTEIVNPTKKKKTGLIIGIICAVAVLLIGGIVVAVLLLNMSKTDPVAMAMNKIMNGEASSNVAIDGTIDFLPSDANSPIARVGVTLDSKVMVGSNINSSNAAITLAMKDGGDVTMKFDEVYAANGELYFKVEGLTEALDAANSLHLLNGATTETTVETVTEEATTENPAEVTTTEVVTETTTGATGSEAANATFSNTFLNAIGTMDGEWLRVSTSEMGVLTDGVASGSNLSCIINMVGDINKNSNSAAELYSRYPFISSSTKNLTVASKSNPVYLVNIDSENFAKFVGGINNSVLSSDIYSCLGMSNNVTLTEADVAKIVEKLPEVYVEVDKNYNFTRLYLKTEIEAGGEVIADLSFTYPTNVSVTEPIEYRNFSDVIQEIMSSAFNLPGVKVDAESAVTE